MRWVLGEGGRATLSICGVPGSITNVGAGLAPGWPVAPPASRLLVLQLRQKPRPTLRRVWGARLPRRPEEPGFRRRSRALASASLRPGAGGRRRPLHGLVQEAASCPPWGPASGAAAAGGDRREPGAGDAAASSSGCSRDGRASPPPIPPRHRLRGGGAGDAVSGAAWRGFSTAVDPGWKPSSTVTEKARQGAATSKPRAWARTPGRLSRDRAARFAGGASLPHPGGMSRGRLAGTQDRADSAALDVRPR